MRGLNCGTSWAWLKLSCWPALRSALGLVSHSRLQWTITLRPRIDRPWSVTSPSIASGNSPFTPHVFAPDHGVAQHEDFAGRGVLLEPALVEPVVRTQRVRDTVVGAGRE